MTDKEKLITYRLKQAEETITDAEKMLQSNFSPRSIINRAYYAAFYSVLALFLQADTPLKTSKHSGVISIFDKEFVRPGKIDKYYSKILHKMAEFRQKADYREFVSLSAEDAVEHVKYAQEFLKAIKSAIGK